MHTSPGTSSAATREAATYARLALAEDPEREHFLAIFLDNRHRVLASETLFHGTIDGASVHPREVVKAALRHNAAAVILAHNHPSGLPGTQPGGHHARLALVEVRVLPCIEALEEALATYGPPEIFNSDQDCLFTSEGFTDVLKTHDVKISMDGKGRWMDNVFIERLWRSLKYEEIYLKAYDNVDQAKQGIGDWMNFYNQDRRHASLGRMTPDQVYHDLPSGLPLAD